MTQWQQIETAPKDGSTIVLTWMDDGKPQEQWPMRWDASMRNGLFPGVVGMWTATDGSFTWNNPCGPTHWKPLLATLN